MPEKPEVSPEEQAVIDAAVEKAFAKAEERRQPQPWDSTTERRAAERRKLKEPEKKARKVGGLISYQE